MQRLALKVRQFDGVVVNDPEAAYARNATRARAQRGGKCIIIMIFPYSTIYYFFMGGRSSVESVAETRGLRKQIRLANTGRGEVLQSWAA